MASPFLLGNNVLVVYNWGLWGRGVNARIFVDVYIFLDLEQMILPNNSRTCSVLLTFDECSTSLHSLSRFP